MKYYLFAGDNYYPGGGWQDFIGAFDSLEEAKSGLNTESFDWAHVVHEDSIVYTGHKWFWREGVGFLPEWKWRASWGSVSTETRDLPIHSPEATDE